MSEVFRKLVAVTGWFAGFVREVDRGIAVGRGYEAVGRNIGRVRRAPRDHRGAGYEPRAARERVRAHRVGRWSADGQS